MLAVAEVAAIGPVAEPTAAALSQFEDLGAAALSQCAAQAIGVGPIGVGPIAVTAIAATVSVRRRSEPLRPGPTAAAAMTPMATTFARAGTVRTNGATRWPVVLEADDEVIGIVLPQRRRGLAAQQKTARAATAFGGRYYPERPTFRDTPSQTAG
jgi:hypothetical protein